MREKLNEGDECWIHRKIDEYAISNHMDLSQKIFFQGRNRFVLLTSLEYCQPF